MIEKKGFFSRLFGKKDHPEPAVEERPLDRVDPPPTNEEPASLDRVAEEAPYLRSAEINSSPHEMLPEEDALSLLETIEDADEPIAAAALAPLPDPVPDDLPTAPPPEPPEKKRGLFGRLAAGLTRTSQRLTGGIGAIFTKRKLDDETLQELEDLLIGADLGVPATTRIISALSKSKYDKEVTDTEVREILAGEITATLQPLESTLTLSPSHRPHVILMTGVNGAGKTTTIGKLAKKLRAQGLTTLLAAGDTFRAAAVEQLQVWGERTGSPVVAKLHGADAAGLAFDAISRARNENIDVVLIDTAGRLQNRTELMDELAKIVRVIKKLDPQAPHDTLLVLDATVGQNALSQAEIFTQVAGVTGLVMTKLDGTARGGVLVALADKFAIPITFIGVGEGVDDLQPFDADNFARALTGLEKDA